LCWKKKGIKMGKDGGEYSLLGCRGSSLTHNEGGKTPPPETKRAKGLKAILREERNSKKEHETRAMRRRVGSEEAGTGNILREERRVRHTR